MKKILKKVLVMLTVVSMLATNMVAFAATENSITEELNDYLFYEDFESGIGSVTTRLNSSYSERSTIERSTENTLAGSVGSLKVTNTSSNGGFARKFMVEEGKAYMVTAWVNFKTIPSSTSSFSVSVPHNGVWDDVRDMVGTSTDYSYNTNYGEGFIPTEAGVWKKYTHIYRHYYDGTDANGDKTDEVQIYFACDDAEAVYYVDDFAVKEVEGEFSYDFEDKHIEGFIPDGATGEWATDGDNGVLKVIANSGNKRIKRPVMLEYGSKYKISAKIKADTATNYTVTFLAYHEGKMVLDETTGGAKYTAWSAPEVTLGTLTDNWQTFEWEYNCNDSTADPYATVFIRINNDYQNITYYIDDFKCEKISEASAGTVCGINETFDSGVSGETVSGWTIQGSDSSIVYSENGVNGLCAKITETSVGKNETSAINYIGGATNLEVGKKYLLSAKIKLESIQNENYAINTLFAGASDISQNNTTMVLGEWVDYRCMFTASDVSTLYLFFMTDYTNRNAVYYLDEVKVEALEDAVALDNYDFENGAYDWSITPENGDAVVSDGYQSSKALKLSGVDRVSTDNRNVTLIKGGKYRISGMYKANSDCFIKYTLSNGAAEYNEFAFEKVGTDWTYYEVVFNGEDIFGTNDRTTSTSILTLGASLVDVENEDDLVLYIDKVKVELISDKPNIKHFNVIKADSGNAKISYFNDSLSTDSGTTYRVIKRNEAGEYANIASGTISSANLAEFAYTADGTYVVEILLSNGQTYVKEINGADIADACSITKSVSGTLNDDSITATVVFNNGDIKGNDCTVFTAIYDDSSLLAVKMVEKKVAAGQTLEYVVTSDVPDGATRYEIFVWDIDSLSPYKVK